MSNMNCMINKHIQHYWHIKSHYSRYTTSILQLLKYYEIDFYVMDSANIYYKKNIIHHVSKGCLKITYFPQWQTPDSWPLHTYCYRPKPDANTHLFPSVRPNYF